MKVSEEMRKKLIDKLEYAAKYPELWEKNTFERFFEEEYRNYKSICYVSVMGSIVRDDKDYTSDYDKYYEHLDNRKLLMKGVKDGSESQERLCMSHKKNVIKKLKNIQKEMEEDDE